MKTEILYNRRHNPLLHSWRKYVSALGENIIYLVSVLPGENNYKVC